MRVRHFGNTANNAFHNVLLLKKYAGVESELPIRMFGVEHAISAPAWEGVEFQAPSAEWVAAPDWTEFPAAVDVNVDYADLPVPSVAEGPADSPEGDAEPLPVGAPIAAGIRSRLFGPLRGKKWAQPAVDFRDRRVLARRPVLSEPRGVVTILYGSSPLPDLKLASSPAARTVSFEHGTLRWLADGPRESLAFRQAYREQVSRSAHLWVTNLDARTLEVAEDTAPGRWTAIPHPFTPDPRVPFDVSPRRARLLRATRSEHLVLLPSSQNWSPHHDKGSLTALRAFVELRRAGVNVGLVAIEWGHQLAESKAFLAAAGVADNVSWVAPLARFALQRMIADVDLVWDQFGLDAFGGLALRVVEQGTPMVSRGLEPIAEHVIGGPVPWLTASTTDEIVQRTSSTLADMAARGRDEVVAETRARYRSWLFEHHSPALTAELQRDVYDVLLRGGSGQDAVAPDEWARRVAAAGGASDSRPEWAR